MTEWIADGESGASVRAKLNGMGRFTQKIISSADFLSCATVPIEIVPAPGVGKAIARVSFWFDYKYNSTPYAAAPSSLRCKYNGSGTNFLFYVTPLLETHSLLASGFGAQENSNIDTRSIAENKALVLTTDNGTDPISNPTGGDSTAVICIFYDIVTLS